MPGSPDPAGGNKGPHAAGGLPSPEHSHGVQARGQDREGVELILIKMSQYLVDHVVKFFL